MNDRNIDIFQNNVNAESFLRQALDEYLESGKEAGREVSPIDFASYLVSETYKLRYKKVVLEDESGENEYYVMEDSNVSLMDAPLVSERWNSKLLKAIVCPTCDAHLEVLDYSETGQLDVPNRSENSWSIERLYSCPKCQYEFESDFLNDIGIDKEKE
jgi:uncharacterized CHY-type Zn-finger protein